MALKDYDEYSKPREKLLLEGKESLSDAELLALILCTGTKNEDVVNLAQRLITSFNGLTPLSSAGLKELKETSGIKEAKASKLIACFEIANRIYKRKYKNVSLNSPKKIYDYVRPLYNCASYEKLLVLFLTKNKKLIRDKFYSEGDANSVNINQSKIVTDAVSLQAFYIVLVHNHPSGEVRPSKNDIDETQNLSLSVRLMGFFLLDHLVISDEEYYSMAEHKCLEYNFKKVLNNI